MECSRSSFSIITCYELGRDIWHNIHSESDVQGYFKLAIAGQDVQNEFPRIWLKGGITVLSNTNTKTNIQILYKNMKRFFSKYVKEINCWWQSCFCEI